MKRLFARCLICLILVSGVWVHADARETGFGVIFQPAKDEDGDTALSEAIDASDEQDLSFVVTNGIKSAAEPCTDALYERRKSLLDSAKTSVIISPAASDWAECKATNGKSIAISRLNRMRELFFDDESSLGGSKMPLTRQSTIAKFRTYSENVRWEQDSVIFATVNLPANNNHYSSEAGRNSEFEDRLIANKDWLQRVFTYAARKKLEGIVLFCDGNPLQKNSRPENGRDGFNEIRKSLLSFAGKYPGKVLIVHGRAHNASQDQTYITWKSNLGTLETRRSWVKVDINPNSSTLFSIVDETTEAKTAHHTQPIR
jgi:hypothetical protein